MYLANLSWNLLTRYLNKLMEARSVNLGSSDRYVLTPKEKWFIDRFSEYCKRREKVEKLVLENTCLNAKEEADEK